MPISDDYLTVPQAAAVIGVTPGRVRQMLVDGDIKGDQVPNQDFGRWLIPKAEAARVAAIEKTIGRPRSGSR